MWNCTPGEIIGNVFFFFFLPVVARLHSAMGFTWNSPNIVCLGFGYFIVKRKILTAFWKQWSALLRNLGRWVTLYIWGRAPIHMWTLVDAHWLLDVLSEVDMDNMQSFFATRAALPLPLPNGSSWPRCSCIWRENPDLAWPPVPRPTSIRCAPPHTPSQVLKLAVN